MPRQAVPPSVQYAIHLHDKTNLGISKLHASHEASSLTEPFRMFRYDANEVSNGGGTYAFYTDDSKFEGLWMNPDPLIASGAAVIIEPNFSIGEFDDIPVVLYQIYRKRKIAVHAQYHGLLVYVDMFVWPHHLELNLEGVPKGWAHYATRGVTARLDDLQAQYDAACDHANLELQQDEFVVYGGGLAVQQWCEKHHCHHIPEMMTKNKQERRTVTLPNGQTMTGWYPVEREN